MAEQRCRATCRAQPGTRTVARGARKIASRSTDGRSRSHSVYVLLIVWLIDCDSRSLAARCPMPWRADIAVRAARRLEPPPSPKQVSSCFGIVELQPYAVAPGRYQRDQSLQEMHEVSEHLAPIVPGSTNFTRN